MAKTIAELEQAVENLKQPLLDTKEHHAAAQSAAQAAIQEAGQQRDDQCRPHIEAYLGTKSSALAEAQPAAAAYAAKRVEFDAAIQARNDARKELRHDHRDAGVKAP